MTKIEYSPYQLISLEHWKTYLQSRSEELRNNFSFIIKGVKDGIIFVNNVNVTIGKIEFWHQAWELEFTFELFDDQESSIETTFGKKVLFGSVDHKENPLVFDFLYPKFPFEYQIVKCVNLKCTQFLPDFPLQYLSYYLFHFFPNNNGCTPMLTLIIAQET